MRFLFYEALGLQNQQPAPQSFNQTMEVLFTHPYMSYWYGATYVLIEGWRELQFRHQEIDTLLQSSNVDLLRRYRNGSFHFQREYVDKRFFDFLGGEESAAWIFNLRQAFSRWFLDYF